MKIKYNRKTLPYVLFLTVVLVVEMHYFSLFTLPKGLEFIVYTNKAKWIGAMAVIVASICYQKHKSELRRYLGFLKRYFTIVLISLVAISFYTIIKYPLNPIITTYGFASYYLYAFLAVPILYVFSVEGGYEDLFKIFNCIAVIMYIITIIDGISYISTGHLVFNTSLDLTSGAVIRDGKVRLGSGALGFLMIIYNFFRLYSFRNKGNRRKMMPLLLIILGMCSIYFTGNSRLMLLTLLASVGVLVWLGDGSANKKIVSFLAIFAGMIVLLGSGVISNFLDGFSSSGTLGGSTIARVGAYKYYLDCFLKNPIFANGFVGDENYYDIVHGASGIYYQTVYVRFFYDDVGIVGQLALLGIFIVGIYIWPVCRLVKIAITTYKDKMFSEGKLIVAIACYILCTTPTLIILDAGRVIAFPIVLAISEYVYANFKNEVLK